MQTNPIRAWSTDGPDDPAEHAVMARVLLLHPDHLTTHELLLDLTTRMDGQAPNVTYRDAICSLRASGLLRVEGESVLPTRAALHMNELAEL